MNLKINVPSALLGALAATLAFLTISAQGINVTPLNPPVIVSGIPTPQQMMRVVEGQPFTVPQGKIFVVTGASRIVADSTNNVWVYVNGVEQMKLYVGQTAPEAPAGLAVSAGSEVAVSCKQAAPLGCTPPSRVLYGYLADAAQ